MNKDIKTATNQSNTQKNEIERCVLRAAKKEEENQPTLQSAEQAVLDSSKRDYVHRPLGLTRPRKFWKRK